MLAEVRDVKQHKNEYFRRWFTSPFFDLVVWFEDDRLINGFQLCYDKPDHERALTWLKNKGFSHKQVDQGEEPGHYNMTPVLIANGLFEQEKIAARLLQEGQKIEPGIIQFVYQKILSFVD
ncbi:hypothetical protein ACFL27_15545 [candidate division CSSED10-310 bacterium]|uniref:Uncharacterized protein n=1 Tax=candidate division CSSED10-310 bacterium TaxID=2855610 RepID=A0ABV6YZH5_UNCC1